MAGQLRVGGRQRARLRGEGRHDRHFRWLARRSVARQGLALGARRDWPTLAGLQRNQDSPAPENFDGAAIRSQFELPAEAQEEEWISLFNGRDLDGWRVKFTGHELDDNYLNTFRVENGLLRVVYDDYEKFDRKFGHIFFDTPFSHYRLRVAYSISPIGVFLGFMSAESLGCRALTTISAPLTRSG